jgi:hypothetical protein
MELLGEQGIDFTKGFQVLIAECIPSDDPVGRASRRGWDFAADEVFGTCGEQATVDHVETPSMSALRAAIADRGPDILVLSAHGSSRQAAGLMIGEDWCVGPGLGPLPPVVLLSACHVAPRGTGVVSVADMLLQEGALAVLGTQVPVDVHRNAVLMARFFIYIVEVLAGRERHGSLLEVWHRVQTSNAINDVVSGSQLMHSWATHPTSNGISPRQEFMSVRSTGQVRLGHVYKDTERVLAEIAEAQGVGDHVRGWLQSPGYVPESALYNFIGRPDRIYLTHPTSMFRRCTTPAFAGLEG